MIGAFFVRLMRKFQRKTQNYIVFGNLVKNQIFWFILPYKNKPKLINKQNE